ncbi:MAG: nitroreductase family protein [Bacteriovoracaceae bacterium]|nr:nitroreductase family protein [Bacteriovoracaceae bacterium]
MKSTIDNESIKQLFTDARSHHNWKSETISDTILRQIYDLAKWAPTSVNSVPMRVVFIKSAEQKEKLLPSLMGSNIEQVKAAPVTAIIAYDQKFFDELPKLFPAMDARPTFQNNAALSEATAFRNSSMQGGYFILAARALGLDVGPMSGFDNAKVDEIFFNGTSWKSNFLCNLGYGDSAKLYPRGPRLEFDVACKVI